MSAPSSVPPHKMANLHKLQRAWTLWYDSPSTYNTENWEMSLVPIMTVHSVEEFFVMLRYMKPLHALRTSSQYHFFQEGVKPMWEDPANKKGGKLWVNLDITSANGRSSNNTSGTAAADGSAAEAKTDLDKAWENVLMATVGEYLDCVEKKDTSAEPFVTGIVMSKRKYHNRLAVWVSDASATGKIEALKKALTKEASLAPIASIVFTKHGEAS
ncbi:eIF4E1 / Eukaryotic translation initiation factor 4E-1 / LeishIF4E1 [Leishmania donovani]|uniref:Eukaryotic_translation_initiation_factor_eIF-4E_-_putative n=4 Tax=Leishmania donovani species complex TaxID=38574 RepID=A0A6L0XI75_LEIIN|nr:putative eukaryotic translation initiation factor eIF-4E [Leishmania infantum JPCM5]XP_003862005.1 eukaryotic translation initiation factor eIF-4E, putative [Leishmania donovani]CAC9500016.1 eukaryotic_translation_initiation_factor_eIF-4E_-_putative [Leishmania infantum]AYU80051.1 eukaryotic translation initiation factor eIF-4E, putative [Leishmania donovani]CAJ1990036.1 eIF4E1 / Eukaryotic translation initiation factor 4E-1 / LeishIF4E1 [Leishmania donovani]CAM69104.1 putative eukaryotic t|eukprot:XP_001466387.1 putative eukaryotic translation initiation factor eIF-4E [Leishmania infantum JPCM5]